MSGKYKVLFIAKDGLRLPKGWISAVLPPGREPSEYEVSEQSPFNIIEVDENPISPPRTISDPLGNKIIPVNDQREIFRIGEKQFKKVSVADVFHKWGGRTAEVHTAPDRLISRSLIWDYGPGRTYSTPQAALDALIVHTGAALFTETHYIRGWSDTYSGLAGYTLHVHDLYPDILNDHQLIIDAEDGETPVFLDDNALITGPLSDDYDPVSVYKIKGITCNLTGIAGFGIASSALDGGDKVFDTPTRIHIEDCILEFVGSGSNDFSIGLMMGGVLRPTLLSTKVIGFDYGAPIRPGIEHEWDQVIDILSSIIDVDTVGLYVYPIGANWGTIIAHSYIKSQYCYGQGGQGVTFVTKFNSVLEATDYIMYAPQKVSFNTYDFASDGNIFRYGTEFMLDKGGVTTLDQYKTMFFTEEHSLDNVDPKINADYTIDSDSPVWKAGIGLGYEDIEGNLISRGILDIGYSQESNFFYSNGVSGPYSEEVY